MRLLDLQQKGRANQSDDRVDLVGPARVREADECKRPW